MAMSQNPDNGPKPSENQTNMDSILPDAFAEGTMIRKYKPKP